jgi:hypothetical protein
MDVIKLSDPNLEYSLTDLPQELLEEFFLWAFASGTREEQLKLIHLARVNKKFNRTMKTSSPIIRYINKLLVEDNTKLREVIKLLESRPFNRSFYEGGIH